jgi:hypothetical protein
MILKHTCTPKKSWVMGMGFVPILISIPKNLTFLGMDMRNLTQNTQYSMGIQIYFYLKLMKMTWNLFIN